MIEDILVGREMLFKVEKKSNSLFQYDESYRIKRVCSEVAIIDAYKLAGEVNTPVVVYNCVSVLVIAIVIFFSV